MILQHYQHQVEAGLWQFDQQQWHVLQQLHLLNTQLTDTANTAAMRGIYIYGPVGRGKTMLMDLCFTHIATPQKIRLHFHHFMARVHQELHQLSGTAEPLQHIAKQWAKQYKVLCFDEFFVSDIGDAMLLGTLWQHLFQQGVVLITTSNAPPANLYLNGLQRSRFLPTITLLQQHCQLLALDSGIDYRRQQPRPQPYYQVHAAAQWLKQQATLYCGDMQDSASIQLHDRTIAVLFANNKLIAFEFMALCSGPRSQLDYMSLAARYQMIAVANVPVFAAESDTAILHGVEENYQREPQNIFISRLDNEARRFIALVDECYEQKCLLLLSAAAPITELYQAKQLNFAFERCISRLYEMQGWALQTAVSARITA